MAIVNKFGGSLITPYFLANYTDSNAYSTSNIGDGFFFGNNIKVSPVLDLGVNVTFISYFPAGRYASLNEPNQFIMSTGSEQTLNDSSTYVNTHLKEGSIIPFQENSQLKKSLIDLLSQEIELVMYRDQSGKAMGHLYLDNGSSDPSNDNNLYNLLQFDYSESTLNIT